MVRAHSYHNMMRFGDQNQGPTTVGPLCNLALMSYLALVVDARSFDFTKKKLKNDFW